MSVRQAVAIGVCLAVSACASAARAPKAPPPSLAAVEEMYIASAVLALQQGGVATLPVRSQLLTLSESISKGAHVGDHRPGTVRRPKE